MSILLQTSHRLMSLPSLINANYWILSRTTMTSIGIQIHSKCVPTEWTLRRQLRSLPWSKSLVRHGSRNSTAEEPLSRIDQHFLYIGLAPVRTGRPNGYRNRSNEVRGAAQPPLPSTLFRWKATNHPHADQQTAGAQEISCQHLQAMAKGLWRPAHSEYTQTITRLGAMKPTFFGLLDFAARYLQTPLGLIKAGPYFQCSM